MNLRHSKKGFTLLEILIVIVILAVVAGLAMPVFTSNIQKSKAQEAYASLSATRNAMTTYFGTNSTYATATFTNIGYDPNTAVGGQTINFAYTLAGLAAGTFTVSASCTTCGSAGNIITVNQAGATTTAGVFA